MHTPSLLETIHERVKREPKNPGFSGRIAIGLKEHAGSTTWLVLACGTHCEAEWARTYPEYDAAVGFDETAAAAVLAGQSPPPGSLYITTGDGDLLARFFAHYFGEREGFSPLGLRVQLARS